MSQYQYLMGEDGQRTAVIVPIKDFEKMQEAVEKVSSFDELAHGLLEERDTIRSQLGKFEKLEDQLDLLLKMLGLPGDDLSADETLYRNIARMINRAKPIVEKDIKNQIIHTTIENPSGDQKFDSAEVVPDEESMVDDTSDNSTSIDDVIPTPVEEEQIIEEEPAPVVSPVQEETCTLPEPEHVVEKAPHKVVKVICEEPAEKVTGRVAKKSLVQLLNDRIGVKISTRKYARVKSNVSTNMAATTAKMSCDQLIAFEENNATTVDQLTIGKLARLYDCSFADLRDPRMVVAKSPIRAFSASVNRVRDYSAAHGINITKAWRKILGLRDKTDFARAVGCSSSTIDHIESGDPIRIASTAIWAVYRYAIKCGCSFEQLFDGIDFPEESMQIPSEIDIDDPKEPKPIVQKDLKIYLADDKTYNTVKEISSAFKVSLLRAWRHHHGYTLADTADTIEVNAGDLIIYEKKGVASTRVMFDLSILYGCSIEQLIGKENYAKTTLTLAQKASSALWKGSTKRTLLRYAADLMREDVIEKMGDSLQIKDLVSFERNRIDLPKDVMEKLAKLYGCRIDELEIHQKPDLEKSVSPQTTSVEPVENDKGKTDVEAVQDLARYVKPSDQHDYSFFINWRSLRKMTISDAAKRSGISAKTLKKLEDGHMLSYPSYLLEDLAKCYRCKVGELFFQQNDVEKLKKLLGYNGYDQDDIKNVAKIKMEHSLVTDLAAWRKYRSISQQDLADLLHIPAKNYVRIEKMSIRLKKADKEKLIRYLQCPAEVLDDH